MFSCICHQTLVIQSPVIQESNAVARKLHDAAAVLFGLKFADDIHYNQSIIIFNVA